MLAYFVSLLIVAAIAGVLSFSKEDAFTAVSHRKIANIMNDFRAYAAAVLPFSAVCSFDPTFSFFHPSFSQTVI